MAGRPKLNLNLIKLIQIFTLSDIRMDWETYNISPRDRQPVDVLVTCGAAFPLKDADGNKVSHAALGIPDGNSQAGRKRSGTPDFEEASSSFQSTTVSTFVSQIAYMSYYDPATQIFLCVPKVHVRK